MESKKKITAVLAVTGAEQYLPTMCIFKGKREPKDVVLNEPNPTWMIEEVMCIMGQRDSACLYSKTCVKWPLKK